MFFPTPVQTQVAPDFGRCGIHVLPATNTQGAPARQAFTCRASAHGAAEKRELVPEVGNGHGGLALTAALRKEYAAAEIGIKRGFGVLLLPYGTPKVVAGGQNTRRAPVACA